VLKWDLYRAITFIRELETALAPNYHVALAGSTLHRGYSDNDLDIIVLPHNSIRNSYVEVKNLLEVFGMNRRVDCAGVHKKWAKSGSTDTKHVEVWSYKGLKIDVFQLCPESAERRVFLDIFRPPTPEPEYYQGLLVNAKPGDTVLDEGTGVPYTLREDGTWKMGQSVYYGDSK
jgi:hypothetical protein